MCGVNFGADQFLEGGPYSCYEDYEVQINLNQAGNWQTVFGPTSLVSIAPGGDIQSIIGAGQLHEYSITQADGNTCWGTFILEDKVDNLVVPAIPNNKLAHCSDTSLPSPDTIFLGSGACGATVVVVPTFVEEVNVSCVADTLKYEYVYDNVVLGTTNVIVSHDALELVPPSNVILPCGAGYSPTDIEAAFDDPDTDNIDFNPNAGCSLNGSSIDAVENNEGFTSAYWTYWTQGCGNYSDLSQTPAGVAADFHPQKVDNNVCSVYTSYTDQIIPVAGPDCPGNLKVLRTWTKLDWCQVNNGLGGIENTRTSNRSTR